MKKSWLCLQPQLCPTEKTEKIVTGETFQSAKIVWCDFVDHLLNLILGRLEAESLNVKQKQTTVDKEIMNFTEKQQKETSKVVSQRLN